MLQTPQNAVKIYKTFSVLQRVALYLNFNYRRSVAFVIRVLSVSVKSTTRYYAILCEASLTYSLHGEESFLRS